MNIRLRTILAVLAVIASLALWYGVWLMQGVIVATAAESAKLASTSQGNALREAARAQARSLTSDTADQRAWLASFVHADILAAVKTIEMVGPVAKVDLKVAGVTPEQVKVPKAGLAHPLHPVSYDVEVRGSFAQVMKAAELLENLPLPLVAIRFDLSTDGGVAEKGVAQWRLNETLRLFTDNDLES